MLPRKYHAPLRNNVAEQRAEEIARQLHESDMTLDFDQLVAKRPRKTDAVFAWHQDQAYWPATEDTRTATVVCASMSVFCLTVFAPAVEELDV